MSPGGGGIASKLKSVRALTDVEQVTPRVMLVVFNPQGLIQRHGWKDPLQLTDSYVETVRQVSGGFVDYQIVQQIELDAFPPKKTGYTFSSQAYEQCMASQGQADKENAESLTDYGRTFSQFGLDAKVKNLDLDEVWLFGGPWFGFYEWNVVGPGLNLYAENLKHPGRTLYVMGFNYERRLEEMLEDLGHRTEGICYEILVKPNPDDNPWDRFDGQRHRYNYWSQPDLDNLPFERQKAHCGNVHFPPNARYHYQWDSRETVWSDCDDWLDYPNLKGSRRQIDCSEWGCTMLGHHKWWLSHLPRAKGITKGKLNNWWRYVVDLDRIM